MMFKRSITKFGRFLFLAVLSAGSAAACEGPSKTAVAAREISELEILDAENLQLEAGFTPEPAIGQCFIGCLAGRRFHRGDIIKLDEVLCVGE